ncbi:MAG TPA: hypothetical protein VFE59_28870 [Trebonia sp.]|nr:hypothetical protein [Trebonia sp.]
MDESVRAALGAGSSVFYDGQWWEVAELAPPSVGPALTDRRGSRLGC